MKIEEKKIKGMQFTTRYWLQGQIRTFIKELDYSVEKVSGFSQLEQKSQDAALQWKNTLVRNIKNQLVACYEDIVSDMASEDVSIFRLQVNTEEIEQDKEAPVATSECKLFHDASTTCEKCGIETDEYGNNELEPFEYCSYPDCGCDGARLCQAKEGASDDALDKNIEGKINIACIMEGKRRY